VEPAWSPDGKKIAFALYTLEKRYKDIGYGYCGIYVINADGSGTPRKLATGPGCASHPTWSPDGKKIAYTNGLGADKMAREKSEIYVCYAPGGKGCMNQPRALTDSAPGRAYYPEWSPAGSEIAFTFADTLLDTLKGGIYKMNADGSDETPLALTEDMSANESVEIFDEKATPAWSPDGDRNPYVRAVNDQGTLYFREIHIMNSDGFDPMLVKDFGSGRDVVGLDWKPLAPKNHGVMVHPPDTGGPSLLLVASALLFSAGVLFYTAVRP